MRTYRTVDSDDATINNNPSTTTATGTSGGQVVDSWLYCVAEFEEEVEVDISITEHTIEEEYTAYVMSLPIRKQSLDPIKFWEVC